MFYLQISKFLKQIGFPYFMTLTEITEIISMLTVGLLYYQNTYPITQIGW